VQACHKEVKIYNFYGNDNFSILYEIKQGKVDKRNDHTYIYTNKMREKNGN